VFGRRSLDISDPFFFRSFPVLRDDRLFPTLCSGLVAVSLLFFLLSWLGISSPFGQSFWCMRVHLARLC